jgi:hypothetical protein
MGGPGATAAPVDAITPSKNTRSSSCNEVQQWAGCVQNQRSKIGQSGQKNRSGRGEAGGMLLTFTLLIGAPGATAAPVDAITPSKNARSSSCVNQSETDCSRTR